MFYIYVLKSLKDKKTYVGYTKNLEERINKHRMGQVKATKHRLPIELMFSEKFPTSKEAKKREIWWKSGAGRRKLKEIFTKKNKKPPEKGVFCFTKYNVVIHAPNG